LKVVAHRTAVVRAEKGPDATSKSPQKPVQPTAAAAAPPKGTAATEERCTSAKSSNTPRSLQQQGSSDQQTRRTQAAKKPAHQTSVVTRSEKTAEPPETSTRQRDEEPAAEPTTSPPKDDAQPDTKVDVRGKPDADVGRRSSAKGKKSRSKRAERAQPEVTVTTAVEAPNSDEEWDLENLISALRDPDDIRTRKVEPRRNSNWGKPGKQKDREKAAKNKTNNTEENEEDDEDDEVNICYLFLLQCFDAVGWAAGRASGLSKTEWWGAGVIICLERGADLHTAQLMPLPLTVSCFSKIQIGFTF